MAMLWDDGASNDVEERAPDEPATMSAGSMLSNGALSLLPCPLPTSTTKNTNIGSSSIVGLRQRQEAVSAKKINFADGQSRFQCPYCLGDAFASCDSLQLHLKEAHRGKIHLCHVCLTLFLSPWKLKRHSESHRKKVKGGGVGCGGGGIVQSRSR